MSRTSKQWSLASGQWSVASRQRREVDAALELRHKTGRVLVAVVTVFIALLVSGCRQDMHDQPKYKTFAASPFFADGQASRPPVRGTVARGTLHDDALLYTGKLDAQSAQIPGPPIAQAAAQAPVVGIPTAVPAPSPDKTGLGFANLFPFPITAEVLNRGETNYNVYCSVCHDRLGTGDGMIVRRGYRRPPSYHTDRLRQAPAGYFFDVITNGFGAMPDYAVQISPPDRWAIVAYIRALQISQNAAIADVPADKRSELEKGRRQQ